jgi:uncharacterized membrane protein
MIGITTRIYHLFVFLLSLFVVSERLKRGIYTAKTGGYTKHRSINLSIALS